MYWYKFISTVLHPIVMPTVGILLYFILLPLNISEKQQYATLSIVFICTYIVPLLLLGFLRTTGSIKTTQVKTVKERKIPVFFMILLFILLGKMFFNTFLSRDIGLLFYGTALALIIVYFIFFLEIKTSLHMLSIGGFIGFFLIFQQSYSYTILPVIIVLILLAGLLGTSRLYLKAHTPQEVYLGFFVGLISQFLIFWVL